MRETGTISVRGWTAPWNVREFNIGTRRYITYGATQDTPDGSGAKTKAVLCSGECSAVENFNWKSQYARAAPPLESVTNRASLVVARACLTYL